MSENKEVPKPFQKLADIPGMDEFGINKDSGFKAGEVNSDTSIRRLTHINGVAIERLEALMRPDKIKGANPGPYSYEGFLGEQESLKEALLTANQIVRERGFTHSQLADWMDEAVEAARSRRFTFDMNGMKFHASYLGTLSKQTSPFTNAEVAQDPEDKRWGGRYTLKNITTGRSFEFTPQIPRWVQQWGFYEGFDTPYNVDPANVIDSFTRTDRVAETKEELAARLEKEYLDQGWTTAIIGEPEILYNVLPQSIVHLQKYRGDLDGEDKIVQILADDNFTVAVLGSYDGFRRFDMRAVIFAGDDLSHPLKRITDISRYTVTRQQEKDRETLRIQLTPEAYPDEWGEVILTSKADGNGWLMRVNGNIHQIDGHDYTQSMKVAYLDSEADTFEFYQNPDMQFLLQYRDYVPIFIYKRKASAVVQRFLLSAADFKEKLGISSDQFVSQVKNIRAQEGVVKATMVINGKEKEFRF